MGGVYGLIAMGLTLQYGVGKNSQRFARRVFDALGHDVMCTGQAGLHPLLSFVICLPAAFIAGFILNITIYRWLKIFSKDDATFESNAMLMSFGLYFILANIGLKIWGTLSKSYQFFSYPVKILGATIAVNRLISLAIAVIFIIAFFIFLNRTRMGKSIRATSQSTTAAAMMGVRIDRTLAICFGTGGLLAAAAGVLYRHVLLADGTNRAFEYRYCVDRRCFGRDGQHTRRGPRRRTIGLVGRLSALSIQASSPWRITC
jgi:branched-chain amino acid transport system permease protein